MRSVTRLAALLAGVVLATPGCRERTDPEPPPPSVEFRRHPASIPEPPPPGPETRSCEDLADP